MRLTAVMQTKGHLFFRDLRYLAWKRLMDLIQRVATCRPLTRNAWLAEGPCSRYQTRYSNPFQDTGCIPVPEFPSLAVPVISLLGIALVVSLARRRLDH